MIEGSFIFYTSSWVLALGLFILMMVLIMVGRKIGVWRLRNQDVESGPSGIVMSALLGLLAFLLAFTFSMSANRYDTRRVHIVEEANAIGTAILRADMYPDEVRMAFRKDFELYVEARILYFTAGANLEEVLKARSAANDFGAKLWARAAQQSRDVENLVASQQMIPAINAMLDASTTRLIGELSRVPDSIVEMLLALSLISAFYVGYASVSKTSLDWLLAFGFCALISLVIYITLDLDRPRRGIIQLSTSHKAMLELRENFRR